MKLYLVRGLPKSGKSEFAKQFVVDHYEEELVYIIDINTYWGNGLWYKENNKYLKYAYMWCLAIASNYLRDEFSVMVVACFNSSKDLEPFLELGKTSNSEVVIFKCENVVDKVKSSWENIEGEIIV